MNLCKLCNSELGPLELTRAYHFDCQKCAYCGKETTIEMAQAAIAIGESHAKETGVYNHLLSAQNLYHLPCHERALMDRFKDESYPIIQEQLDILNRHMLTSSTEVGLSLEELYPLLRTMQQITANVSIAIGRKRDKIKISEAEIYRAKSEEQKKEEKLISRAEQEKKTRLAKEREDPTLRTKRKAIEGLMSAFGLSKEQAEEMLAKQAGTK